MFWLTNNPTIRSPVIVDQKQQNTAYFQLWGHFARNFYVGDFFGEHISKYGFKANKIF